MIFGLAAQFGGATGITMTLALLMAYAFALNAATTKAEGSPR